MSVTAIPFLSPIVIDKTGLVKDAAWIEWLKAVAVAFNSPGTLGALLADNNLSDLTNATAAKVNLGLGPTNEPTFANVKLSSLTANLPVVTNSAGKLASLSYGDFAESLGLGPTDVPIFAGLSLTAFHGILSAQYGTVGTALLGSSLSYAANVLNTIQSITTAATPTFKNTLLSDLSIDKVVITDSTGLLASGTNTDTEIASAVSLAHDAVTVSDTATISLLLTGQALSADVISSGISHSDLSDLGVDDHSQYLLLAGRTPHQTISDSLTITKQLIVGASETSTILALFKKDTNAQVCAVIENLNAGTGAFAELQIRNVAEVESALRLTCTGTGWTTSGGYIQDAGIIATEANLSGGLSIITKSASPIRIYTSNNERIRIDSSGCVGIGTTLPATLIELYKTSTSGAIPHLGPALRLTNGYSDLGGNDWNINSDYAGSLEFYTADASSGGPNVISYIRPLVQTTNGVGWAMSFGVSATNAAAAEVMRLKGVGLTLAGVMTINPTTAVAPLTLGANGQGKLVTGLNADQVDNYHYIDFPRRKNFIINGDCCVMQRPSAFTLIKDTYGFGQVDRFAGMATGTAVSAGILTMNTVIGVSNRVTNIRFREVTITGTGILYLRYRMEADDASVFYNQSGSFSCYVYHTFGAAVNHTVTLRKANAKNDFSGVTDISSSSAISVPNQAITQLKYEGASLGDCSNGLEIEIKIECGAIATKNWYGSCFQMELGAKATVFEYRSYIEELLRCQRYYYTTLAGVNAGTIGTGLAYSATKVAFSFYTPVAMVKTPTPGITYGYVTDGAGTAIATTALALTDFSGNVMRLDATVAAGLTAGQASIVGYGSGGSGRFYLDAEL